MKRLINSTKRFNFSMSKLRDLEMRVKSKKLRLYSMKLRSSKNKKPSLRLWLTTLSFLKTKTWKFAKFVALCSLHLTQTKDSLCTWRANFTRATSRSETNLLNLNKNVIEIARLLQGETQGLEQRHLRSRKTLTSLTREWFLVQESTDQVWTYQAV